MTLAPCGLMSSMYVFSCPSAPTLSARSRRTATIIRSRFSDLPGELWSNGRHRGDKNAIWLTSSYVVSFYLASVNSARMPEKGSGAHPEKERSGRLSWPESLPRRCSSLFQKVDANTQITEDFFRRRTPAWECCNRKHTRLDAPAGRATAFEKRCLREHLGSNRPCLGAGGDTHRGLFLASARAVRASSLPASYFRMRSSVSMLDWASPVTSSRYASPKYAGV